MHFKGLVLAHILASNFSYSRHVFVTNLAENQDFDLTVKNLMDIFRRGTLHIMEPSII